jgi:hypothetical protein
MPLPIEHAADPTLEQDDRFPSGPWDGFYLQPGLAGRQTMELFLTFRDGKLRGEGRDVIGEFLITGTYERESGKCWWSKRYVGKHDVAYAGYNEGRGIWGVWEMSSTFKGGFHIWPHGQRNGESQSTEEEVDTPAMMSSGGNEFESDSLDDSSSFSL